MMLPVVFGLDELACAFATQAAMPHVAPRLDGRAFAGQQPMVGSTPRIGFDSLIVQWLNGLGLGACTRNGVGEDNVAKHCLHILKSSYPTSLRESVHNRGWGLAVSVGSF